MTTTATSGQTSAGATAETDADAARLTGLLALFLRAHQLELITLAARADDLADRSRLGGPWTITPGSDALASLHPDLVLDFTQSPSPAPAPHAPSTTRRALHLAPPPLPAT